MIRGTIRPVPRKTLDLRASIHNRFDVEVIDAFTGEVKQRARAFNLICDALWTRLLHTSSGSAWSPQAYFNYILFGSGEGTPSASDVALFALLGAKSVDNTTTSGDVGSGVIYRQGFITLQAEEYVGATLTEVGVGYDSTHIATHALLEDMNGNPISIEKTATDVIRIYATIYVHFSAGGWYGGSVSLAPPPVNGYSEQFFLALTGKAYGADFIIPGVGTRTASLTGPTRTMTTVVDATAKKITASKRIPAGEQNLPIRCIVVEVAYYSSGSYYGAYTFCLTPGAWAPMAEIKAAPCGTGDGSAVGFSTAFPVKTGSKVYVDGVQASGAAIRPGPADGDRLERWMNSVASLSAAGTPIYATTTYSVYDDGISFDLHPGASSATLENPFYAVGMGKVRFWEMNSSHAQAEIFASDDLEHWTSAGTISLPYQSWTELTIPAALRTKRYWRLSNPSQTYNLHTWAKFVADAADPAHNIIFSTPPAAGAVITCDYVPDCIAKDENHVFDLTLELTLGEYQEV